MNDVAVGSKLVAVVIDDEQMIRNVIRMTLEEFDCEIHEAANGQDGVMLVRDKSPDLVITDMIMPDKEGIETVMDIRKFNGTVKILGISGGGRTRNLNYLEIAGKLGANDVLPKPFSPDELVEKIRGLLPEQVH